MRQGRSWTGGEIVELKRLLDLGLGVPACALSLGRSRRSVSGYMKYNSLHVTNALRPVTAATERKIEALTAAAVPVKITAALVNRSPGTVHMVRSRNRFRSPPRPVVLRVNVTNRTGEVLTDAGRPHGFSAARMAGAALELLARGRAALAERVIALPPPPVRPPSPIMAALQPVLLARIG
jgi:hypothetical protein